MPKYNTNKNMQLDGNMGSVAKYKKEQCGATEHT